MRSVRMSVGFLVLFVAGATTLPARQQPPGSGRVILFEGARLITGDGSTPVENSAFLVENNRFTRVARKGDIPLPAGAVRVDLTGKTVMPAIIDAHAHLGYIDLRTNTNRWEAYTRENLMETVQRFAYYGVGTVMTMGNDGGHGDLPWKLREQDVPNGARFRTAGGAISQPGEGHMGVREPSWYHVTNEAEVRKAVQDLATHKPDLVKILVDDRVGKIPQSMPPSLYGPLIDEAHKHNLRVAAHMMSLKDSKGLLRANIDGFAHTVRDRQGTESDIDDEFVELLRQRHTRGVCLPPSCQAPWPDVFMIPTLPDPPNRGGYQGFNPYTMEDLPWMAETLPPDQIERLRSVIVKVGGEKPSSKALIIPDHSERDETGIYEVQKRNLTKLVAMNPILVKIGMGTDSTEQTAGWSAHVEMADMIVAGKMTPAQVIVAATKTNAEILRLDKEVGTIASGKSADFLVLEANPLENIANTRRISKVYLRGAEVDRAALRTKLSRP